MLFLNVMQGLNDDTAVFQAAISDRLGIFTRKMATGIAALIICECANYLGADPQPSPFVPLNPTSSAPRSIYTWLEACINYCSVHARAHACINHN